MVGGDFALMGTAVTDDGACVKVDPTHLKLFQSEGHAGSCAVFDCALVRSVPIGSTATRTCPIINT